MVQHTSGGVDDTHFASSAVSGVQSHDSMSRQGSLKEKLAKIYAENLNCLSLSCFRKGGTDITLKGGEKETFVAVFYCQMKLLVKNGISMVFAFVN